MEVGRGNVSSRVCKENVFVAMSGNADMEKTLQEGICCFLKDTDM